MYIGGNGVVVSNNNITYNAPDNIESHAILVDIAGDVKIINNNINYAAKSEGDVKTIAIIAYEADNLVFENNKLNAAIPSVPVSYAAYPIVEYLSDGVYIENSKNVSFNKNDINVSYNVAKGSYDTINAVHFISCDDSKITNNNIELNGHSYSYGLTGDNSGNLLISGNEINVNSDSTYACALQICAKSTALVNNNNLSAKAVNVTYPVYLDDWGNDKEVNLTKNNIKGQSNTVYGVYVEENKTAIKNNVINVTGNHVYGIITHQTDSVIENNNITANGKDIGIIDSAQSGVDENTTGIIISEGSSNIGKNKVVTTGNATIALIKTSANITDNQLSANKTSADESIKNINSNVYTSGNTAANKKDENITPAEPVFKITANNNAKVDYGFTYSVRVTVDGESVGAGKEVSLKIAGKTLKAKTNNNGYAVFTLKVKPKTYTVNVIYNNLSQKYKVTVKNVIQAKNVNIKKSAKVANIKVTLKTSGKKAIKSKKVTLKINGKKVTAKTNSKGVATFKVKKNILKKLKAGKKYKYSVIYGEDTVVKTLKVKK